MLGSELLTENKVKVFTQVSKTNFSNNKKIQPRDREPTHRHPHKHQGRNIAGTRSGNMITQGSENTLDAGRESQIKFNPPNFTDLKMRIYIHMGIECMIKTKFSMSSYVHDLAKYLLETTEAQICFLPSSSYIIIK